MIGTYPGETSDLHNNTYAPSLHLPPTCDLASIVQGAALHCNPRQSITSSLVFPDRRLDGSVR